MAASFGDFLTTARDWTLDTANSVVDIKTKLAEIEFQRDQVQPMPDGGFYLQTAGDADPSYWDDPANFGGFDVQANMPLILGGAALLALLLVRK